MPFSELVKNFEKMRSYMREFYVYGFRIREEFDSKSGRTYDNERRRLECVLGEYTSSARDSRGKNVYLSIDSRNGGRNPLYRLLRTASFTDRDITLHFLLMDMLDEKAPLTLSEILERLNSYTAVFSEPMIFDDSGVRKKLAEYEELGLIRSEKRGRVVRYFRSDNPDMSDHSDVLDLFSEIAPCGLLGSFMIDWRARSVFEFKHHYISHALDSEILCGLLCAMSEKRSVTITVHSVNKNRTARWEVVPLKIFSSVQSGRQWLMAYSPVVHEIRSYRIDLITDVRIGEISPRFDELRETLTGMQQNMWGVACNKKARPQQVEFLIHIGENEEHIYRRLLREKRCGTVERIDKHTARFYAELVDSSEIRSWIRTFTGRLIQLDFKDRTAENLLRSDMKKMYEIYGIGGDENAVP